MGRGQRQTEQSRQNARSLLYGRRRQGSGPVAVDDDVFSALNLASFRQLVAYQLSADGYISGSTEIDKGDDGSSSIDIISPSGITRIEAEEEGFRRGLKITRISDDQRNQSGGLSIPFKQGPANAADLDQLEMRLLAYAKRTEIDYIERELSWSELERCLQGGQSLELAVNTYDEDNSGVVIHDFLVDLVDHSANNDQEANDLIYRLGCVPLDEPEGFLDAMYEDRLGRQLLANRGLWRVRRNRQG